MHLHFLAHQAGVRKMCVERYVSNLYLMHYHLQSTSLSSILIELYGPILQMKTLRFKEVI